jgi:DNA-directed RNA polymerase specialized sigma24 family protein
VKVVKEIDTKRRNEVVLTVLSQAAPMLRSLAFQFSLEYDELYQMAAEAALLNYEKAQASDNPHAYLYGVVRNVFWYRHRAEPTLSLDIPLDEDGCATYADLLPAPSHALVAWEDKQQESKTRALYASLRRLPLEVQHYIARVHNLDAYQPARPRKGRYARKRSNKSADPSQLSRLAYHALRRDRQLAHAICGEPKDLALDFERDFMQIGGIQE